jgi:hypothetical protein
LPKKAKKSTPNGRGQIGKNEINEGSRRLLPVCKSAAIFRHKAIGITVGLNFVKILQFFFVFCESSVIIGTFQGEDVE